MSLTCFFLDDDFIDFLSSLDDCSITAIDGPECHKYERTLTSTAAHYVHGNVSTISPNFVLL